MRFSDMVYQRPDFDKLESDFRRKIDVLINSDSVERQAGVIDEINLIREDVDTAMSLARIRQTIDTRDPFYDAESSFFDKNSPRYQALIDEYYGALTTSRFRPELKTASENTFLRWRRRPRKPLSRKSWKIFPRKTGFARSI